MAIELYSGTPGSYKSYHAVQRSINWLKSGGNLICNFPLDYMKRLKQEPSGVYQQVNNLQLTVDYLINFACEYHHKGVKAQTLVVIDEASIKFNSREFNNHDRMEWINFFANHRHFNFNILLITQSDKMLDKQIRCLIETEYKHRSLKNYNWFGKLISLVFRGCFMCVEYWYPCNLRSTWDFCVFNRKIAACYDTMGLFVDTKNKMAAARRKLEAAQDKREELKPIGDVTDPDKKEKINHELIKFLNCISDYINTSNADQSEGCCR